MASSPSSSSPPPLLPLPPPQPSSVSHSSSPSLSPKHESRQPPARESNPKSPPKKSSPVHWTDRETLALIQAYQEKWYSLKKGQLKAFQWEEVAVTVAARCGFDEPSKTSTQCRHKIEKLRKRYRSELQKPYGGSWWQYFDVMDQMERGPMPLNARPIAAVKPFPTSANSNSHDIARGYGNLHSSSADYCNNSHSYGDGGGSDESDERWEVATRNKSKSINNLLRADVKKGVRSVRRVAMERGGVSGGSNRVVGALRELIKGNPRDYGIEDDSDDDDDEDEDEDDVEEEEQVDEEEEEGGDGGGGMELAAEIRGFAEKFIGMENKKIEVMKETHRYRMEMEKRRMEMILDAERKITDTIDRAFGAYKKAKVARQT